MWKKSLFVDVGEIIQGQFTLIKDDPCVTCQGQRDLEQPATKF